MKNVRQSYPNINLNDELRRCGYNSYIGMSNGEIAAFLEHIEHLKREADDAAAYARDVARWNGSPMLLTPREIGRATRQSRIAVYKTLWHASIFQCDDGFYRIDKLFAERLPKVYARLVKVYGDRSSDAQELAAE
jgi:hypothetical protein